MSVPATAPTRCKRGSGITNRAGESSMGPAVDRRDRMNRPNESTRLRTVAEELVGGRVSDRLPQGRFTLRSLTND